MPQHKKTKVIAPSQKPALILVHGFRGSPIGLEAIAADLRQAGYEVHIPSIPPFAGSTPLQEYSPKSYAGVLKEYIREHHLVRPILIGHSMGSIVVSATARIYPDIVNQKLVLLSPIATKPLLPFRIISPLAAVVPNGIVDYITTKYLFVPHDKKLFKETMAITHQCSHDQPPTKSDIFATTKFSTRHCVRDFRPNQKIAIIAGKKDRLVSKRNIEKLAAELEADLTFLEDSGHLHNYEKPRETATAILSFIQK